MWAVIVRLSSNSIAPLLASNPQVQHELSDTTYSSSLQTTVTLYTRYTLLQHTWYMIPIWYIVYVYLRPFEALLKQGLDVDQWTWTWASIKKTVSISQHGLLTKELRESTSRRGRAIAMTVIMVASQAGCYAVVILTVIRRVRRDEKKLRGSFAWLLNIFRLAEAFTEPEWGQRVGTGMILVPALNFYRTLSSASLLLIKSRRKQKTSTNVNINEWQKHWNKLLKLIKDKRCLVWKLHYETSSAH